MVLNTMIYADNTRFPSDYDQFMVLSVIIVVLNTSISANHTTA